MEGVRKAFLGAREAQYYNICPIYMELRIFNANQFIDYLLFRYLS